MERSNFWKSARYPISGWNGRWMMIAKTDILERADKAFAEALVEALDIREHETGMHSKRVACHTVVLARRFTADAGQLRQIYWGSLLHDIGKIGIPDTILLKQGTLNEDEWQEMRTHPEKGYRIVAQIPGMGGAAEIILSHEERFDGTGYPRGLRGQQIPFGARLFALIDTLDAMTSDRPYRKALSFDQASAEIASMSGIQFDPVAVQAFLAEETVLREMVASKCMQLPDPEISGEAKLPIHTLERKSL
ncbi:MAG: HD-GYP domain-containing protein [Gallionellaceae bacterium]|nr:HD-GYP domain-containing protein [Gallionellaceae bacterium]